MKFTGRNVSISPKARIADSVRLGDGSAVYDNDVLEEGVVIGNDCVIGEPQSSYYENGDYVNPVTRIGRDSLIRSHSIIYSGVGIGVGFSCGHRVTIREGSRFGLQCRLGTNSDVQAHVEIGDFCWFHSGVFLAAGTGIGSFVLVYPHVIMLDDKMPPSNDLYPVKILDYAQIGAGACITPGVSIAEHALIGSGAVVTKDVAEYSCVVGNPAKHVKDVRDMKLEDGSPAYPWPYRFDRGMPWEGLGFEAWSRAQ